jgi:hypothetical protein
VLLHFRHVLAAQVYVCFAGGTVSAPTAAASLGRNTQPAHVRHR